MNFEYLGYFLDCELVAVSLLRGAFAGRSFGGLDVYMFLFGRRLHAVPEVRLSYLSHFHEAVYLLEDARCCTPCTSTREN